MNAIRVALELSVPGWTLETPTFTAGDIQLCQACASNLPGTWHVDMEGDRISDCSMVLTSEVEDSLAFVIFRENQLVRLFAVKGDFPSHGKTFGALSLALAETDRYVRSAMMQSP